MYVPYQKCPICNGTGISLMRGDCPVCDEKRIISMLHVQQISKESKMLCEQWDEFIKNGGFKVIPKQVNIIDSHIKKEIDKYLKRTTGFRHISWHIINDFYLELNDTFDTIRVFKKEGSEMIYLIHFYNITPNEDIEKLIELTTKKIASASHQN